MVKFYFYILARAMKRQLFPSKALQFRALRPPTKADNNGKRNATKFIE
jgi:hypothetical protein